MIGRRRSRPAALAALVALVAGLTLALLAGCTAGTPGTTTSTRSGAPAGPADGPNVLRVLASSETKDLWDGDGDGKPDGRSVLGQLEAATGVHVSLTEVGTLDGSAQIASGAADGRFDAVWLSSNRYLSLLEGANDRVATSTKIAASPVILGVRPEAAKRLGWDAKAPTWADIAKAVDTPVAGKRFTYAMTNPGASNSGFSTLVSVSTALASASAALDEASAAKVLPQLRSFFAGQAITAGSTGWITDKFWADPSVDGLFSYEASLLSEQKKGRQLTLVRPADGVITADYPLSLLRSAAEPKRALFDKAVAWLTTAETQRLIMDATNRRPLQAGVRPDARFGTQTLIEIPFPSSRQTVDDLVGGYLNQARRPAATVYVLDRSGSMAGERLASLKRAMGELAGASGHSFTTFHQREDVTIVSFNSGVDAPVNFTIPEADPAPVLAQLRARLDAIEATGGTALYEALDRAYAIAGEKVAADPSRYVTVVALTDGESNAGLRYADFVRRFDALPAATKKVPTFSIVYGSGNSTELTELAAKTGGRAFDATKGDLGSAFREIRGYQ